MANPPVLTVRRNFPRPAEALVKRLGEAPTGWVVDANGRRGALDYRIRPLTEAKRFCGVALTVCTLRGWRFAWDRAAAMFFAPVSVILMMSALLGVVTAARGCDDCVARFLGKTL